MSFLRVMSIPGGIVLGTLVGYAGLSYAVSGAVFEVDKNSGLLLLFGILLVFADSIAFSLVGWYLGARRNAPGLGALIGGTVGGAVACVLYIIAPVIHFR
jgi:hypothetical protein